MQTANQIDSNSVLSMKKNAYIMYTNCLPIIDAELSQIMNKQYGITFMGYDVLDEYSSVHLYSINIEGYSKEDSVYLYLDFLDTIAHKTRVLYGDYLKSRANAQKTDS